MDSTSSSGSITGQLADFDPPGEGGSAFLEVNQRNSVLRRSGKFNVGDPIVRDTDGTFLPANAPEPPKDLAPTANILGTAGSLPKALQTSAKDLVAALEEGRNRESYITLSSDLTPPSTIRDYQPLASRPQSTLAPSKLADTKAKVTWTRASLRKLNASIDKAQQDAMKDVASGTGATVGWIIVGRGVTSLPSSVELPGRTKEDILWDNLGEPVGHRDFWINVTGVGGIIALICEFGMGASADRSHPLYGPRCGFCTGLRQLPRFPQAAGSQRRLRDRRGGKPGARHRHHSSCLRWNRTRAA
jgi:hypothetical protein